MLFQIIPLFFAIMHHLGITFLSKVQMTAALLTKDLVTTAFNDHIQFDTDREFDKIEILSISEPFTDPKDASRTCFDISANIYVFDEENASAIIVEADVYEEAYTLYFDHDGCCVQVDEH